MGAQRTSFEKLQRDRNKKAKQALKRERRQTGEARIGEDGEEVLVELNTEGELSAAELLAQIEHEHAAKGGECGRRARAAVGEGRVVVGDVVDGDADPGIVSPGEQAV